MWEGGLVNTFAGGKLGVWVLYIILYQMNFCGSGFVVCTLNYIDIDGLPMSGERRFIAREVQVGHVFRFRFFYLLYGGGFGQWGVRLELVGVNRGVCVLGYEFEFHLMNRVKAKLCGSNFHQVSPY